MRRLGVRARLTVFVTAVFLVALSAVAAVALHVVEDRLVGEVRRTASAVLASHTDQLASGIATAGRVPAEDSVQFFYRYPDGRSLAADQYLEFLAGSDLAVAASPTGVAPPTGLLGSTEPSDGATTEPPDDTAAEASVSPGMNIATMPALEVTDATEPVDLGDDRLAVATDLVAADGEVIQVGVAAPYASVRDGLDALRQLLWFAVPGLVAAVGLTTWVAAGRALRPVDAITRRVRVISGSTMDERVPVGSAGDEVSRLAATMNDMLARLERSGSRHRQFVADASHELRSPIAVSRAQLEVARADPGAADWCATADAVLAEQAHLGELVDDLLCLSRLDEIGVAAPRDVDLDEIVETEAARERSVPVEVTVGAAARVSGDPGLLRTAVRNVVDNATNHAAAAVHVTVAASGVTATVTVDDDGPGIPAHDRARVFDRFVRLDEARDARRGGTGLGLAIVREVCRAHGGDAAVEASPTGGARLVLTLPVAPAFTSRASPARG